MISLPHLNKLIYFENLFSNSVLTKFLKKKFAIMYRPRAPREIEITDIKVPIHLPKKIPEIIKSGDPKPSNIIHTAENTKYINKFM